jgi:signal transduction histidine kinase/predicted ATPase
MGKSALLQEFVRRELKEEQSVWVISGQCRRGGDARSALVEAATDLVYRIIGAHRDETGSWVSLLQSEAGESLPVLRRSIPAFALIDGVSGEEREDSALSEEGQDTVRLLSRALGSLFHLFSSFGEGLVMVLDDIHLSARWELETLRNLLTLEAGKPLLIIASYQPEGLNDASPLFDILGGIPDDVRISTLLLRGLDTSSILSWLFDSFGGDKASFMEPAEIFADRFAGSPSLIHEALIHLHESGNFSYHPGLGWSFDSGALQALEGTESIRQLIFNVLDRLEEEELNLLTSILCFGGKVDEGELFSLVSAEKAVPLLRRLRDYGIIRKNGRGRWEIIHRALENRILSELPHELIEKAHLAIGRLFFSRRSEEPLTRQKAVFHFMQAGVRYFGAEERKEIAETALQAAAVRLAEGEHDTGLRLAEAAFAFAGDFSLEEEEELFIRYHFLRARCLSGMGETEGAIEEYHLLIGRVDKPERLMSCYAELIEACSLLSRFEEALDTGKTAFELAGMKFLEEEDGLVQALDQAVGQLDIDRIDTLPRADTCFYEQFLTMVINLDGSVYSQRPQQYGSFIRTLMLFVLNHGGGAEGAFIFTLYGLVLATRERRYEEAEGFGRAGLRISDAFRNNRIRTMCRETYGAHIAPWTRPLAEITSIFGEGFRSGQSAGEAQFSGFILMHRLEHDFFMSVDFHELLMRGKEFGRIARTLRNREAIDQIDAFNGILELFLSEKPEEVQRKLGRVREILEGALKNSNFQAFAVAQAMLLIYAFIFGDDELAISAAGEVERHIIHLQENYIAAPAVMLIGIRAAWNRDTKKAEESLNTLKAYELGCRENFGHLRLLLEAEIGSVNEEMQSKGDLYEKVIRRAQKGGDLLHTAIANELCAKNHYRSTRTKVAGLYFLEAYRYWAYLGIRRKAELLKSSWSALFPSAFSALAAARPEQAIKNEQLEESRLRERAVLGIDAMAMVRASRELTEDLREELLLERMLRIVMESTGAQKGFFIIEKGDDLLLRARYIPSEDGFTIFPLEGGEGKPERLVQSINLSIGVLRYVRKQKEPVILEDAAARGMFINDPYFRLKGVRSVLCFPIPEIGNGSGMIYLENETVPGLFTPERVELVSVLSKQATISLQNARLYEQARSLNRNLQEEVLRRSQVEEGLRSAQKELRLFNEELEQRVEERTRDLTRSYRELQETQKQLIEAEKMASLGSLVAGIAHEVNTPIGVAFTAATFLQDQSRKTELDRRGIEESADLILRNLKRAVELIGSFKQVAVDQASEALRLFDLRQYLEDVVVSLRPRLKQSRVTVAIDIAPGLELKGYPGVLSQIFTNLISNSLIHGYDEGSEGAVRIEGGVKEGMVTLLYRDDGKGMDARTAKHVFDPFFTTRRGSGGSGLGMHIVYNLVTGKLGGSIECESAPARGVCFTIRFPSVQQ